LTHLSQERSPDHQVQSLFPASPAPPFHDAAALVRDWDADWGCDDDVSPLRTVLVRRPGDEWKGVRADCWDEDARSLVDPARTWFWESRELPDVARMQADHDGLVAALRAEGVEVVDGGPLPPRLMNAVYVRDPMCVVRGGAVIGRMGPLMRRGEERYATQAVAALGMPVLRTISGTGMLEGGTVMKLTPRDYAFGASIRCNPEGGRQLAEVLAPLGIELIVVPLAGWSIHLDGHLSMIDRDKALCDIRRLPYWFIERLRELGMELIELPETEDWAINGLAVRPGRILLSEGQPRTVERLRRRGVEIVEIPYSEIQRGGGGIHCTTMELRRDRPA
jgi:N-dimethylarginine dimethylaminohydrolase